MRIKIVDARGVVVAETQATGSRWLAVDNGFANIDTLDFRVVAVADKSLRLHIFDDAGVKISGGTIECNLPTAAGDTIRCRPGALEITLLA